MSRTAYNYHLDVSHSLGDSEVQCKFCDKTFQHSVSLKRHLNSKHKENPNVYQCMDCQKALKRKDYLTVHRKLVHTFIKHSMLLVDTLKQSDGSYKCNNCGEVFSGLKADEHIVTAHIVEQCRRAEEFLCPVCNKCFSSKSNLEQHKKIIHYDGPMNVLSCEDCEFLTKHKSSLDRHKKRKHSTI